ncbi:unnamed protein product [Thlaspi arvense]|uniref:UBX domain-containing protein n=1 Tax=Thlaspi arvense TaxID=13288 RepID=A0AAU9S0H8_THLAR|nr:unnamed protein product [Thlaspi arvense]
MVDDDSPLPETEIKEKLISSFIKNTSPSRETAITFLETHHWDLDAAVSAFTENNVLADAAAESNGIVAARTIPSNLRINIPVSSHSPPRNYSDHVPSRLRSRSPLPPSLARYPLASNQELARKIYFLCGLSGGTDSNSDEAEEDYNGGDQSGTIVQDPKNDDDVDDDDEAKESDVQTPIQTTYRIILPEPQVVFEYIVTIWRNGFTVDDGPLTTLDDPDDAHFLEIIESLESPRDLNPQDTNLRVRVKLIRRQEEDFNDSPFQGVARTLAGPDPAPTEPQASSPPPSMDLVVDPAAPITSIQLRLADGTRIVSRFNTHLTVRDVRGLIDESRPGGSRDYQLLIMGSPPKPVLDFDQTIEKAGISNSVLIQKY